MKPKIAWCHHANDSYFTDEQMQENKNLRRFYIEFVEKAAYDRLVNAVSDLIFQLKDQKCILPGEIDYVEKLIAEATDENAATDRKIDRICGRLDDDQALKEIFGEKRDK